MWVDSLLRKLSPFTVLLLSLASAMIAFALLGVRDTNRVYSVNPTVTYRCAGFIPDIRKSTELQLSVPPIEAGSDEIRAAIAVQECARAARDQFPTLLLQSLAIGLGMAVVLAGLARSGARRRPESPQPVNTPDLADQLSKLVHLHESGGLSDDEFATAKRSLLE
jgi:hypothetical protein